MFVIPENPSARLVKAARSAGSLVVDLACFLTAAAVVTGAACTGASSCANAATAHPAAVGPAVAGGR